MGKFIASFTLGEINKFIEPLAGAVLAKSDYFGIYHFIYTKRPRGLFPQKVEMHRIRRWKKSQLF